jgi:hypothetical protein
MYVAAYTPLAAISPALAQRNFGNTSFPNGIVLAPKNNKNVTRYPAFKSAARIIAC